MESAAEIKNIKRKIEKVIQLNRQLQAANNKLSETNEKLSEQLLVQKRQLQLLEENNKVNKLAQVISGSDQNSREVRLKINEYVREIDKCLALLNR